MAYAAVLSKNDPKKEAYDRLGEQCHAFFQILTSMILCRHKPDILLELMLLLPSSKDFQNDLIFCRK